MTNQSSEQVLYLAKNFQPDIDWLIENGVTCFGVKGSGKTNLLALLVEQLSRFLLPQVIFDTENEYESLLAALPHGILATIDRLPSAYEILTSGLQVVVSLQNVTPDSAAMAMADLINDLFTVASSQAPHDRVPCVILLDEAAHWLPQKSVSHLSKEARAILLDAFSTLAARGRKFGLTPCFFTQQISQIHKDVIRQSGLHILMRQSLDVDIRRYGEYMAMTSARKLQIAAFGKGEAVIHGLPDGRVLHVRFYERSTAHTSHTPKARAAIAKFAGLRNEYDSLQAVHQPQETVKPVTSPEYITLADVSKIVCQPRTAVENRVKHLGLRVIGRSPRMIAMADLDALYRSIVGP